MMVRARRRRDGDTGAMLDALIITSGCAVLSWIFLIQPYVHAEDITLLSEVDLDRLPARRHLDLGRARPLGVRRRDPEPFRPPADGRGAGPVGCRLRLRLDPAARVLEGGRPDRLGWVLFYVLWGAAALHPAMRELTVEQPRRPRRLNPATLAALSATSLIAPLLLVWRDVVGAPSDGGCLPAPRQWCSCSSCYA